MCRWFCWNLFYCLDTKKKLWIGKASCRSDGSYRARLLSIAGIQRSMWPADGIKSVYTPAEKDCAIYLNSQHLPDTHTGSPTNVSEVHNANNKYSFLPTETADVYSFSSRPLIRCPFITTSGNLCCGDGATLPAHNVLIFDIPIGLDIKMESN